MSDTPVETVEDGQPQKSGCLHCGTPFIEEGYATPLCQNCRSMLAKFPLPPLLLIFAAIVAVIFLFSLSRFPTVLNVLVHQERGERAEKEGKMRTAIHEYNIVLEQYPDNDVALAHSYIAYFHAEKIEKAIATYNKLMEGNEKKDIGKLTHKVNTITKQLLSCYLPPDKLVELLDRKDSLEHGVFIDSLRTYLSKHTTSTFTRYMLAHSIFDDKNYEEILQLLNNEPNKENARLPLLLLLKAAAYRELHQYDKAEFCCRQALEKDIENASAYSSLAKIALKKHDDQQAQEFIEKAMSLEPTDASVLLGKAMVCHYLGKTSERDECMAKVQALGSDRDLNYYYDIFNGAVQWR